MSSVVAPTSALAGPALSVGNDDIIPSSLHTQDGISSRHFHHLGDCTLLWTSPGYGAPCFICSGHVQPLSLESPTPNFSFKHPSPQSNSHVLRAVSSESPAWGGPLDKHLFVTPLLTPGTSQSRGGGRGGVEEEEQPGTMRRRRLTAGAR